MRERLRPGPGIRRFLGTLLLSLLVVQSAPGEERNDYNVKNAFRDAISQPARSTVRIICDSRRSALGVVVDSEGYILTKASELKGDIVCQLYDGRRVAAETLGIKDDYDLALLKVNVSSLTPVTWSDDKTPPVGSWLATPGLETVPISVGVVSVTPRLIQRRTPALGIILEDSDAGPRVHEVVPDSGAAKAGVENEDVVTHLNGRRVEARAALIQAIREHRPGDEVELKLLRDGKEVVKRATLGELNQVLSGDREMFQNNLGGRLSSRRAGFPSVLQHDTVLQPHQCGGPLVDLEGKVVGLNIARASRVASYAIPAAAIKPLLRELKSGHLVSTMPTD